MDGDSLQYHVLGATGTRYTIVAEDLLHDPKIWCNCPSGVIRKTMCRHIAELLSGDVTNLEDQSVDLYPLYRAFQSSPAFAAALAFPAKTVFDIARLPAIFHLVDRFCPAINDAGWVYQHDAMDPAKSVERLCLFGCHANGKAKKTPSHVLEYHPITWKLVAQPDGGLAREDIRPRPMPWTSNGVAFKSLGRAAPHFLRAAGVMV